MSENNAGHVLKKKKDTFQMCPIKDMCAAYLSLGARFSEEVYDTSVVKALCFLLVFGISVLSVRVFTLGCE